MRNTGMWVGAVTYLMVARLANAQDFDPSINIGNQVDRNVSETLAPAGVNPAPPASVKAYLSQSESQPPAKSTQAILKPEWVNPVPSTPGISTKVVNPTTVNGAAEIGEYSGFGIPVEDVLKLNRQILVQESFNNQNSFIGTGDTNTYNTQLGLDISGRYGTDIQPFVNWQRGERDVNGVTSYHADTFGGSVVITQKLFPFIPGQPKSTYNLRDLTPAERETLLKGQPLGNIFPNFDAYAGLTLAGANTGQSTLKKSTWTPLTEDGFGVAGNFVFDFYLRKLAAPPSFIPNAISLVPTYKDQMVMAHDGTSSSAGVLSIQDRNTYDFVFQTKSGDIDDTPTEFLAVTQFNTLLHDTNQEPLTLPMSPIVYQNWAQFGLSVAYTKVISKTSSVSAKIQYAYEAFNSQYEAHNIVASVSIGF